MKQENLQKTLEAVAKSGITVNGDFVLEKHVEYEIDNVENGGIGIQIINGKVVEEEETDNTDEGDDDGDDKLDKQEGTQQELNYFAPTKNLQELLKQDWFKEFRTRDEYNGKWTDAFVSALMATEWKDGIAKDWAVQGKRSKVNQIKGYIVGLLVDADVIKGSYDGIAAKIGITKDSRTFSNYMSKGKKQPYADWVKEYVLGLEEK